MTSKPRSLREISEAMTPQFGSHGVACGCLYEFDELGISIFCDEAVRKALVTLMETHSGLLDLHDALTAAIARAQENQQ